MVATFPYEKAVLAVAESDLFGDRPVLERWSISIRTLQRWRERARNDPRMSHDVAMKKKLLLNSWQEDVTRPLKIAFDELARRMPLAETATDAKIIFAIAGAVKILGELKLDSTVLLTATENRGDDEVGEIEVDYEYSDEDDPDFVVSTEDEQ